MSGTLKTFTPMRPVPLDDRLTTETKESLKSLGKDRLYVGLRCTVLSTGETYKWTGAEWVECDKTYRHTKYSDDGGKTFTGCKTADINYEYNLLENPFNFTSTDGWIKNSSNTVTLEVDNSILYNGMPTLRCNERTGFRTGGSYYWNQGFNFWFTICIRPDSDLILGDDHPIRVGGYSRSNGNDSTFPYWDRTQGKILAGEWAIVSMKVKPDNTLNGQVTPIIQLPPGYVGGFNIAWATLGGFTGEMRDSINRSLIGTKTGNYIGECLLDCKIAPSDPSKYTWTKVTKEIYTHIKYSDDAGESFTGYAVKDMVGESVWESSNLLNSCQTNDSGQFKCIDPLTATWEFNVTNNLNRLISLRLPTELAVNGVSLYITGYIKAEKEINLSVDLNDIEYTRSNSIWSGVATTTRTKFQWWIPFLNINYVKLFGGFLDFNSNTTEPVKVTIDHFQITANTPPSGFTLGAVDSKYIGTVVGKYKGTYRSTNKIPSTDPRDYKWEVTSPGGVKKFEKYSNDGGLTFTGADPKYKTYRYPVPVGVNLFNPLLCTWSYGDGQYNKFVDNENRPGNYWLFMYGSLSKPLNEKKEFVININNLRLTDGDYIADFYIRGGKLTYKYTNLSTGGGSWEANSTYIECQPNTTLKYHAYTHVRVKFKGRTVDTYKNGTLGVWLISDNAPGTKHDQWVEIRNLKVFRVTDTDDLDVEVESDLYREVLGTEEGNWIGTLVSDKPSSNPSDYKWLPKEFKEGNMYRHVKYRDDNIGTAPVPRGTSIYPSRLSVGNRNWIKVSSCNMYINNVDSYNSGSDDVLGFIPIGGIQSDKEVTVIRVLLRSRGGVNGFPDLPRKIPVILSGYIKFTKGACNNLYLDFCSMTPEPDSIMPFSTHLNGDRMYFELKYRNLSDYLYSVGFFDLRIRNISNPAAIELSNLQLILGTQNLPYRAPDNLSYYYGCDPINGTRFELISNDPVPPVDFNKYPQKYVHRI